MKYLIELELTPSQVKFIGSNSIERVFNTAIRLVQDSKDEDRYVSQEDLETTKPFISHLWHTIRDATIGGTGETGPMPDFTWWQQ